MDNFNYTQSILDYLYVDIFQRRNNNNANRIDNILSKLEDLQNSLEELDNG